MTYESYKVIYFINDVLRWYIIRVPRFSYCYCRRCWSRKEWRKSASAILALNARKESAILLVRPVSLFTVVLNKREVTGKRAGWRRCAKNAEAGRLLSSFLLFLSPTVFCIFILDCCRGYTSAAASCNSRLSRRDERKKTCREGTCGKGWRGLAREKRPAGLPWNEPVCRWTWERRTGKKIRKNKNPLAKERKRGGRRTTLSQKEWSFLVRPKGIAR